MSETPRPSPNRAGGQLVRPLERRGRLVVLQPRVEHQPVDDPAAKVEVVEAWRRIGVQRPRVLKVVVEER
jgi:hypothetical protein